MEKKTFKYYPIEAVCKDLGLTKEKIFEMFNKKIIHLFEERKSQQVFLSPRGVQVLSGLAPLLKEKIAK